jgi:hypothetical protein
LSFAISSFSIIAPLILVQSTADAMACNNNLKKLLTAIYTATENSHVL